jgi:hypothetical protein
VALALVVGQPPRGNLEQPRRRGRPARLEAAPGDERRRKRLCREVGRLLGVERAAGEVAEQRFDVAVAAHSECLGIV